MERFSLLPHHFGEDPIDLSQSGLTDQGPDRVREVVLNLLADLFDLENGLLCQILMKPLGQAFVTGEEHEGKRAL